MELITCARPYAKAAFSFAKENDEIDVWTAMLNLASVVYQQKEVSQFLSDTALTVKRRVDVFVGLFEDKQFTIEFINFITILAEYNRFSLLVDIAFLFRSMKISNENIEEVFVTTALPLNDKKKQQLIDKLSVRLSKSIRLHMILDDALIGGMIIKSGDMVIDGSVRFRLQKLAESLGK